MALFGEFDTHTPDKKKYFKYQKYSRLGLQIAVLDIIFFNIMIRLVDN